MLLNSVMARLALFLLGFWSIEAGQQSLRKGNLTGAQGASSGGLRSIVEQYYVINPII